MTRPRFIRRATLTLGLAAMVTTSTAARADGMSPGYAEPPLAYAPPPFAAAPPYAATRAAPPNYAALHARLAAAGARPLHLYPRPEACTHPFCADYPEATACRWFPAGDVRCLAHLLLPDSDQLIVAVDPRTFVTLQQTRLAGADDVAQP